MSDQEFYVEIEVPDGDAAKWAVVGEAMDRPTANPLYDHFLDMGVRVRMTSWSLQVVRSAPEVPDRQATMDSSVEEARTEVHHHGVVLPSVHDLLKRVESEVEHLGRQGAHFIGEIPHPHHEIPDAPAPILKISGPDDPAEQGPVTARSLFAQAADTSPDIRPVDGAAPLKDATSPDIAAETSLDLPAIPAEPDDNSPEPMPGEAGYVEHMLRVSRGQQGTRVTRQQG